MAPYTDDQIMMTLAALANISTAPRPSGESLPVQQQRIMDGINGMLQNPNFNLATAGLNWTAVWVGLSQSNQSNQTGDENLSYIATGTNSEGANAVAVVVRGTTDWNEILEDIDCGPAFEHFSPSSASGPYNVSPGFLAAFNYVTAATDPPTSTGVTLLQALQALVNAGTTNIYVTGHSLGGAVATMVALYLQQSLTGTFNINLYTFAAPTAGDQTFATAVNSLPTTKLTPNGPMCYVNSYDVVPYAYLTSGTINLNTLSTLYSNISPSPAVMSNGDNALVNKVVKNLPINNPTGFGKNKVTPPAYAQPTPQQTLNFPAVQQCPAPCAGLTWDMEAAFQHNNNTYLPLLNAPKVDVPAPTITGVIVADSAIAITGENFFTDNNHLGVDIGVYQEATGVQVNIMGTSITCTPAQTIPGSTPFAVCVTTANGSFPYTYWGQGASSPGENDASPSLPGAQSTSYPPYISGVSFDASINQITITGNFFSGASVYIGLYQPATNVTAKQLSMNGPWTIGCTPAQTIIANTPCAVCVTTEYGSCTCTRPAPSISPNSAVAGSEPSGLPITVTGTGYVPGSNISNIQWNGVDLVTTFVSSTSLTATVPAACIQSAGTATVTVNNPAAGGTSLTVPFTINPSS